MGQELVNVLRVSAVTPDGINVELPEYPVADAQLPPGFKGLAAGRDGPRWDPRLPIEELIGVKPVSASLVALGVPQAVRLTAAPAGDTTGLADFVARDTAAHFFLIHLACSFDPLPGQRFVQATVQVTLTSERTWQPEQYVAPEPVAWSMQPRCLAQVTDLSRTQKIGADLKVIDFSASHEKATTKTRCVIRAFNELQSNPRWDFGPTNGDELVGTQRLVLVTQTMGAAVGEVSLTARARRGRWRLTGTDERRALDRRFWLPG